MGVFSSCSNCGSDWCSGVDCIKEPLKKLRTEIESCIVPKGACHSGPGQVLLKHWQKQLNEIIGDK